MINSQKYLNQNRDSIYLPEWEYINCNKISDDIEEYEKNNIPITNPELYNEELYNLRHCRLKRATFSMEHVSFIFNVVIGFVCLLVGIFNYQDKSIPKGNLIGILCGILGFILTIIYIIIGGILFIQYYPSKEILRKDSDASVAEKEGGKGFKCYYYSSNGDKTSFYARYIDYMKSQFNYNKKLIDFFKEDYNQRCVVSENSYLRLCSESLYVPVDESLSNCQKLFISDSFTTDHTERHDLSAKFFTVLFFSILMIPFYFALIFFSFGLSKGSSDYKSM